MTSGFDGFTVSPPAVTALAGTFTSRQQDFRDLGAPLRQAGGGLNTGDGGLDAATRTLLGQVDDVFGRIGDVLGQLGNAVTDVVAGYQDADQQVAGDFQGLVGDARSVPVATLGGTTGGTATPG
jgi:uncharacterized protein YukE